MSFNFFLGITYRLEKMVILKSEHTFVEETSMIKVLQLRSEDVDNSAIACSTYDNDIRIIFTVECRLV